MEIGAMSYGVNAVVRAFNSMKNMVFIPPIRETLRFGMQ